MLAIHDALSDCLKAGFIDHNAAHCIVCNPQSLDYDNHDHFGLAHQVVAQQNFSNPLMPTVAIWVQL